MLFFKCYLSLKESKVDEECRIFIQERLVDRYINSNINIYPITLSASGGVRELGVLSAKKFDVL